MLLYNQNKTHLFFYHSILCIRILDVVPVKSRPVKNRLEVPQGYLPNRLPNTCHERGGRPWHEVDNFGCRRLFFCIVRRWYATINRHGNSGVFRWGFVGVWCYGGCRVRGLLYNYVDTLVQGVEDVMSGVWFPARQKYLVTSLYLIVYF